ncbi:hypothetical protein [Alteriqipengyuania sp. 357]
MVNLRRVLVMVAACAAPVLAGLVYLQSRDFWAADTCVDRGGSYHYDRHECSFTDNYQGEVPPLWPF